ncbi:CLUMA_CG003146, isoform C [Clunio marinus]|uniref:CLUMA_CG003146, isoform C n=1 Tax=Clunio marinus TaxID=568069 RepID=A0A1J1HPD6_9DIPT|nr:CLUMA_CG003146, isoform C [Clunio marinus]
MTTFSYIFSAQFVMVSTFLMAAVFAEPPAPRSSYLPPQARSFSSPSSQYGAPSQGRSSFGGQSQPRTNYGAPQRQQQPRSQYGAPSQQPSSNYGAPAQQISSSYGAPAQQPSSNYGAPAQQPNSNYGPPSTSYGVPAAQDFNNFDSQRANSYQQAPSNSYGVPSQDSFSGSSYTNGGNNGYPSSGGYSNGGYQEPAKSEFQYDVQDQQADLEFGHKEQRDGSVATGKYYVLLPDGRKQVVNYIADENGYRPTITYEDTGRGNGYNNNAQGYNNNAQGFGGY